ncbi:uncharacterized protein L969DRAFT_24577 [Mixia osmundae IAM 14324]|uniref:uncharacterized protein n=1 Tax=Mixia osmundae (strain CBS 9802 / IAM 14324 / JCM 22182 / KY 12970) TaxID=764103 RepID=UPI0004A559FB|nr:uncharacterized protein L969DRAFT_24577 [Mixia osmundae IAM 14324]KEI39015.1 hypothetical protein L969DRAFT_24577 [Mixia osmundae IAM 14324]
MPPTWRALRDVSRHSEELKAEQEMELHSDGDEWMFAGLADDTLPPSSYASRLRRSSRSPSKSRAVQATPSPRKRRRTSARTMSSQTSVKSDVQEDDYGQEICWEEADLDALVRTDTRLSKQAAPTDGSVAFKTAKGNQVARPSAQARSKAQALLDLPSSPQQNTNAPHLPDRPRRSRRPTLSSGALASIEADRIESAVRASQVPDPAPSSSAASDTDRLIALEEERFGQKAQSFQTATASAGFISGFGKTWAAPSSQALRQARAKLEADLTPPDANAAPPPAREGLTDEFKTPAKGFKVNLTEKRAPLGACSPNTVQRSPLPARALRLEHPQADKFVTIAVETRLDPVAPSNNLVETASMASFRTDTAAETPLRPLRSATNHLASPAVTSRTTPKLQKTATPTRRTTLQNATPGPSGRKIHLGMTPRSAHAGSHKKFKTPFKNGQRPAHLDLARTVSNVSTPTRGPVLSKLRPLPSEQKRELDISIDAALRLTWQQAQIHPCNVSCCTESVPLLTLKSAARYAFAPHQTAAQALQDLLTRGMTMLDQPWVTNHWSQILWKLSSQCHHTAAPSVMLSRWSYEHVMHQLGIRYDIEINQAKRSILKRIHEADASPASSMILLISDILLSDSEDDPDNECRPIGLELSDGWYRIRATIDAALLRAIAKGKLKTGSKIAISEARLKASIRDGVDALRALECSTLAISANAMKLARWDARLGLHPGKFVSTLRSLNSDGGAVGLMDLEILSVLPIGFNYAGRQNEGEAAVQPWHEGEEMARQDRLRADREAAQEGLTAKLERELEEISALHQRIQDAIHRRTVRPSAYNGFLDPSELLDELLEAKDKQLALRDTPAALLHEISTVALQRIESTRFSLSSVPSDIMALYPEKQVRSFRVLRVQDSVVTRPRSHEALLTVWDIKELGVDFQVGQKYWVSQLWPASPNSWHKSKTISLKTTKSTRWRAH